MFVFRFKDCHAVDLFGKNLNTAESTDNEKGIIWKFFGDRSNSLKRVHLSIRPQDFLSKLKSDLCKHIFTTFNISNVSAIFIPSFG